jgi:hypothetical protein
VRAVLNPTSLDGEGIMSVLPIPVIIRQSKPVGPSASLRRSPGLAPGFHLTQLLGSSSASECVRFVPWGGCHHILHSVPVIANLVQECLIPFEISLRHGGVPPGPLKVGNQLSVLGDTLFPFFDGLQ